MALMLVASGPLAAFIDQNPSVKMLALSFLLLIGMMLVADGFGVHVPRGYVYVAMGFSGLVEALNLLAARRRKRRKLELEDKPELLHFDGSNDLGGTALHTHTRIFQVAE